MKSFIQKPIEEQQVEKAKSFVTEQHDKFNKTWKNKYASLGKLFDNPAKAFKAAQTVQMLENQQRHLSQLDEMTITTKFGDIAPKVLDILRLVYPNQVAHELVDVQTMRSVVDVVYFVKPVYGQTKNQGMSQSMANSTAFSSAVQASEEVIDPAIQTPNGSIKTFTFTPSYTPIRPTTIQALKNGIPVGTDTSSDGVTGVIAGAALTAGTVTYAGGASSISITFGTAPVSGDEITVLYLFNSEVQPDSIGSVDIVFSTFQVKARKHPLKLKWSVDAALVTQGSLNFDVEDVLSLAGAQELKAQKDFSLTDDLRRVAGAPLSNLTFSATVPSGNYAEWQHAQGFRRTLVKASNAILNDVGRGMSSWFVVGTQVNEYMTYLDSYVEDPNKVPIGVYKVGTYRGLPIFLDSRQKTDEFLTGYKGRLFGDSGYILAEYIELYATPTIELDDFIGRKGIASFFDKRVITPGYFKRGRISNMS